MTPRKHRAYGRSGLFEYGLDGDVHDVPDNPRLRPCPPPKGCGAAPGQPCTSPSMRPGGRRELKGHYHDARTQEPQCDTPAAPAPDAAKTADSGKTAPQPNTGSSPGTSASAQGPANHQPPSPTQETP
jgi:hypothetical protein